jgi:purine catabolism regulator
MLTVRSLVADRSLGLRVLAGHAGLDRPLAAAAVSELVEPGPWLQGGELLMTIGLLLPEDRFGDYIAHLDAAGVPALALGLGAGLRYQEAPDALIRAADAAGMPLLTVPDGIPFIAVTKAVFAEQARQSRRALEWALRTQRALTAAAVSPGGLAGILAAHRRATGRAGVVVDQLGRVLVADPPGQPELVAELAALTVAVRAQGLLGAAVDVRDGRRREVHPLGSRRLRALLLLDGPADAPGSNQVTGDLVSLLSLELEREFGLGVAQRRDRGQVLARLARGVVEDVMAARWLAAAGLPDAALRAAVVAAPRADDLAADLGAVLPGALVRVVRTTTGEEDTVELAAPADVDLSGVLATLAAGRPAGIGVEARPGALAVSLRQARSALPESRLRGRHVRAEDLADSRLLLSMIDADRLRAYADAVLAPLDADRRGAELIRALGAFLEHNGHWDAAATALAVHRHTMRNRIDAVQRLTGRRMASAQDRQELWLALRARDIALSRSDH